jgi:uncharacterized membrane protein YukC
MHKSFSYVIIGIIIIAAIAIGLGVYFVMQGPKQQTIP